MNHDIVVIGTSAGGVEALKVRLSGLPEGLPASIFITIHTASDAPGYLADILGKACPLPGLFEVEKLNASLKANRFPWARAQMALVLHHNRALNDPKSRGENQRYRASGLNLVVAAIILWNTVYLERAIQKLRDSHYEVDELLLPHLSPLGWEHINLTGDYLWRQDRLVEEGKFRSLRTYSDQRVA